MKFDIKDLTLDQANLIIIGLRKLPVEQVEGFLAGLVQNLQAQAQAQQPKPEEVAE